MSADLQTVCRLHPRDDFEALVRYFSHPEPAVRARAIARAVYSTGRPVADAVLPYCDDHDPLVRLTALDTLRRCVTGPETSRRLLAEVIRRTTSGDRRFAPVVARLTPADVKSIVLDPLADDEVAR